EDVHVYHAPVIAKHQFMDKFLSPFPYLMSRNHMLYSFRLIRRHHARGDVLNLFGYFVSLTLHAVHLAVRGKRRSAALMMRGLWDGLLDREDRIHKDRMEETAPDYRVEAVDAFAADTVFDKDTSLSLRDALRVFGTARHRVLHRRMSLFTLFVAYYLSAAMA